VIPNILSRLVSVNIKAYPIKEGELDILYAYNTILVRLADNFAKRIIDSYNKDNI